MEQNHMQKQITLAKNSLFEQGYLDDQFNQLEDLQDDANPNFVEEIVTLFYSDSMRLIRNVETALENYPLDFCKLDDYMHQFKQLEDLQDDANPNFVEEIVTLFYSDSMRLIRNVETALENYPLDFCKLDDYMHQFKGSSSSIGAKKVKDECTQFQECCKAKNAEGCIRIFQKVKQEHATLKRKLETYFQISRQGMNF